MDHRLKQAVDGAATIAWLWFALTAWRRGPRDNGRPVAFWTEVLMFVLLGCWSAVKAIGIV